jgi:hypothetical protein
MDVEELKALALAIEPLAAAAADPHGLEQFQAYNQLVARFRERVTMGLNQWTLGQEVEPGLTEELWLVAKALPGARQRAVAGAPSVPPGVGRTGVDDET